MALIPGIGQAVTLAKANVKAALRHIPFNSLDEALEAVKGVLRRLGLWTDEVVDGSATRLAPGGDLSAHEAVGGHALDRHVGKTSEELAARLVDQPGITGASTFTDRAVAETSVAETLERNSELVRDWVAEAAPGQTTRFESVFEDPVGTVLARNASGPVPGNTARVVIRADSSMPDGYFILTAYPQVSP